LHKVLKIATGKLILICELRITPSIKPGKIVTKSVDIQAMKT
jgi:hypothetical protein